MPQRSDYSQLKSRLLQLRKHFLPKKFSPTGVYSVREYDLAKAYRLLSHAELEFYFESISKKVMVNCIQKWKTSKKPSDAIICLLAAYHSGWNDSYQELLTVGTSVTNSTSAEAAVDVASRMYINRLRNNNGIKEDDLKKILLPIGIRFNELDPTWLTDINDFATSRGEVAHSSSRSLTTSIDPKSEYNRINSILLGVKKIDDILKKNDVTIR